MPLIKASQRSCLLPLITLTLYTGILSFHGFGEELKISLQTEPGMENIKPNVDAAKLVIRVEKQNGVPLESASLHLELDSPPKNTVFSTGFPIVEGTALFRGDFIAPKGVLELNYFFPIRGTYRLRVSAVSTEKNSDKVEIEWPLVIREEPAVVWNFTFLVAILVLFGTVSGFVLGRSALREASSVLRTSPAIFMLAFVLLLHPTDGFAHDPDSSSEDMNTVDHIIAQTPSGDSISMFLEPSVATVGQLSVLKGSFVKRFDAGTAIEFTLSIENLDHHKEIFHTCFLSLNGEFRYQIQFVDGAAHRISLAAKKAGSILAPAQVDMVIAVHAIHPPTPIVFRTFALLLSVAAISMFLSFIITVRVSKVHDA